MLSISVPVLDAIYPISIMLIVLGLADNWIKNVAYIYPCTIGMVGVVSVIYALENIGIRLGAVSTLLHKLPLYSLGLGWVGVAVVAILVCVLLHFVKNAFFAKSADLNMD